MQTILVTGGAGFIGSHCVDALIKRGDRVICVDNFNSILYDPKQKRKNIAKHQNNENFVLIEEDIADEEAMKKVFELEKIDKILHLAATAGVRPSLENPGEYVRSNVTGTTVILELARIHKIDKIVLASSSSVYGGNKKTPFHEDDAVDRPLSPYAATKKSMEVIAACYHHIAKMCICCLRYLTVYGPRNRHDMAIYQFAKNISEGKEITVYGDAELKRDWTFVADIVKGTVAALDKIEEIDFEILNIGFGSPISVLYMVELLEKELGKKAIIKKAPIPLGDVPITFADTTKIKKLLGWKPETPVEEGVKKFVEWFKQQ